MDHETNVDERVVADFGREWQAFDQADARAEDLERHFERYFSVFPWDLLPDGAVGFDAGCGSGRWARFVAPRVGRLHCVDASDAALNVARRALAEFPNCEFHAASVNELPFVAGSMDFGYSLGVLHHVPDTESALASCVTVLRDGAPFLVYLYYALDGRPWWFRALFRAVDTTRRRVSQWPHGRKLALTNAIALLVYLPLARAARLGERVGRDVEGWPLSFYRHGSLYTMRNDALDRFGTRLERRFAKDEIAGMLERAGLRDVVFSSEPPYWCAAGVRAAPAPPRPG